MPKKETGTIERPLNAAEFLRHVLEELSATVGAIWVGSENQLIPMFAVGLEESQLFDDVHAKQFLQQILTDTLMQARAQSFDTEGLIEPGQAGHATLFVTPLSIPNAEPAVILIVERPNLPQQQRQAIMRHIELRCRELNRQLAMLTEPPPEQDLELDAMAATLPPDHPPADSAAPIIINSVEYPTIPQINLNSGSTTPATRNSADSQMVLDFVLALQRSLDVNEVANVIVNDGRVLFGVDRVSLALKRGRRIVIKAVSGQESVHPRGNLIRALRRLTQLAIASGEPFRFDGSLNTVPKQLEEPLAEFIQEGAARFLLIVPLIEPERLIKPEEPLGGGKPKRVVRKTIGALIIEQMNSSEPATQLKTVLDSVTDHIAAATYNSYSHSSIFLLPLWRMLGRLFEWLRGRRLAIAFVLLLTLAVAGAALVLVPWPYRVEGSGQLMPVIQREVFAPWDGQVIELLVEDHQRVVENQELIKIRNDELEAEYQKVRNELDEKTALLDSLKIQYEDAENQGRSKLEEKHRIQGKRLETEVEMKGAKLQYEVLKDRRDRLTVRAPIAGIVTTFQIQQLLLHRPVKRGDVLVQVMDDKGDWQLELEIAEHRIGRILNAQKKLSPKLDIEYRLLTSPEHSYHATLQRLATRTVTAEEKGSVMEARASLNTSDLPEQAKTIGAEVRARIGCGESSLGDVLFGDVIEFVQKYLWW